MRILFLFICVLPFICCKKEAGTTPVPTHAKVATQNIGVAKKEEGFASLLLHDSDFEKYHLVTGGSLTAPNYGLKDAGGKLVVFRPEFIYINNRYIPKAQLDLKDHSLPRAIQEILCF